MTQPPVYQGPLLTVYQWQEPLQNGSSITFERCVRPSSVGILPFLDSETILLIREQQLGRTQPFIDIPGGRMNPGETPETAAARELQEEIGHAAGSLLLWDEEHWDGLISFQTSLFIAKHLTPLPTSQLSHDPTEQIELLPLSLKEAGKLCLAQNLRRSQATLAILRIVYDVEARKRLNAFLSEDIPRL